MTKSADFMVPCAKNFPRCLHGNVGPSGYAVKAFECACHVSREAALAGEPIYAVRLLPELRERIEEYAREQGIPVSVAIAESVRAFTSGGQ